MKTQKKMNEHSRCLTRTPLVRAGRRFVTLVRAGAGFLTLVLAGARF